jgi:hypothetical protein
MPRQPKGPCQHGWLVPDDGWILKTQLSARKRIMRCRLCNAGRIELYEYGRWKPLQQLGFTVTMPEPPAWHDDFTPEILKEDWDWSS